jgi:predicted ArsR family transcriptional regulator
MEHDVRRLIDIIYIELKLNGSGTYEELARRCKLRPDQVWRRLSDMEDQGFAEPLTLRRKGTYGRYQRVWKVIVQ